MGEATGGRGRVSRLLSRALLVFGGAVATTAAAWAISSASAAADPLAVPGVVVAPVPGVAAVGQVVGAVTRPIGPAAQPVTSLPVTSLPVSAVRSASDLAGSIDPVTDRPRAGMTGFGVVTPNPSAAPVGAGPARDSGAPHHIATAGRPLPTVAHPTAGRLAGSARAVTAAPRAGLIGVALPGTGQGLPSLPAGQLCGGGSVPASTGGAGGAGPGASVIGAQFGQPALPGLLPLGPCGQGSPVPTVTTGRQPGVTPD